MYCGRACSLGYVFNGTTCIQCANHTYGELGPDYWAEGYVSTCTPCTLCEQWQYESEQCRYNQNRVCTTCRTRCNTGEYIVAPCNSTANMQCRPCVTRCPRDKYLSGTQCDGTSASDTVLAACQPCIGPEACQAGTQYLPSNCSGTERAPNTCAICSAPTCSFDTYRGGCGGYRDTQCLPYSTCPAGSYLSGKQRDRDGVCQPCRNCTLDGLPTIVACSRYENTVCGGTPCNRTQPCASSVDTRMYCDYAQNPSNPVCGKCPVRALLIPPGKGAEIANRRVCRTGTARTANSAWSAPAGRRARGAETWCARASARRAACRRAARPGSRRGTCRARRRARCRQAPASP